MDNLELYNKVRAVPKNALKEINAGRLKGKSDINPMWRIKTLTEQFGPCGKGWFPEIVRQWTEQGAEGVVSAFVEIKLYVKYGDEWGKPISAVGGSAFVANETKGLYTSDECYKMAYTDAISVGCKMLGIGADVYWDRDDSKYSKQTYDNKKATKEQIQKIIDGCSFTKTNEASVCKHYHVESFEQMTQSQAENALKSLYAKAAKT